jgi:predicted secreted protein
MTWVSFAALYFIIWWLVLFAMLPFSLKTQDDDGEFVLGTTSSAPRGPHMLRAVIRTTIVSLIVFGLFVLVTRVFGYNFDDFPRIAPDFN